MVFAGGAGVVSCDMAVCVGFWGAWTGDWGVAGTREGVYAGSPCFTRAVDGRFLTVCMYGGATIISDVAHVVGLPGSSEGGLEVARAREGGQGLVPCVLLGVDSCSVTV
jgi:hypothetical protein